MGQTIKVGGANASQQAAIFTALQAHQVRQNASPVRLQTSTGGSLVALAVHQTPPGGSIVVSAQNQVTIDQSSASSSTTSNTLASHQNVVHHLQQQSQQVRNVVNKRLQSFRMNKKSDE